MDRWDEYFMCICDAVSAKSSCHSRQVGAIIARDKSVVSTGYNGPPSGYKHCETCARRKKDDYSHGKNLSICPAAHAETNAIANAAKLGVSTLDTTLYLNTDYPCRECMKYIVTAGISEVVSLTGELYHKISYDFAIAANIILRRIK
jgi:dCMP deaminase